MLILLSNDFCRFKGIQCTIVSDRRGVRVGLGIDGGPRPSRSTVKANRRRIGDSDGANRLEIVARHDLLPLLHPILVVVVVVRAAVPAAVTGRVVPLLLGITVVVAVLRGEIDEVLALRRPLRREIHDLLVHELRRVHRESPLRLRIRNSAERERERLGGSKGGVLRRVGRVLFFGAFASGVR